MVYLNSPGGNLREGMRLGKFFFDNKIETVVETKTSCASACALAFLGGRDGDTGKPHRTKASNSGLGFHSFTREFDAKSYTADDLKTVVQMTQTQVFVVAEYLKAIGADHGHPAADAAGPGQPDELSSPTTRRWRSTSGCSTRSAT